MPEDACARVSLPSCVVLAVAKRVWSWPVARSMRGEAPIGCVAVWADAGRAVQREQAPSGASVASSLFLKFSFPLRPFHPLTGRRGQVVRRAALPSDV